jgi:hypothetical protein
MSATRLLSKLRESFPNWGFLTASEKFAASGVIDPPALKIIPVRDLIHDRIYAGSHQDGYGLLAKWNGPANIFEHAEFMLGEKKGVVLPHFAICSMEHTDEMMGLHVDCEFFIPRLMMHNGSPTYQKAGWRKIMDGEGGIRIELGTFDAPA